jgi:hypothetical protein
MAEGSKAGLKLIVEADHRHLVGHRQQIRFTPFTLLTSLIPIFTLNIIARFILPQNLAPPSQNPPKWARPHTEKGTDTGRSARSSGNRRSVRAR